MAALGRSPGAGTANPGHNRTSGYRLAYNGGPANPKKMNPSAIFSKTGKGVQEASGKTGNLSRADRAVLAAIDGKSTLDEVQAKFEKIPEGKFAVLIVQLDKDGYIREVISGNQPAAAPPVKAAKPAAPGKAAAPGKPAAEPAPPADGDELDFTQAIKVPPKPQVDLAAAARAEAQRLANEQQMLDIRKRQDAEARAHAQAEASLRGAADTDAKVKAARDAALRATVEAKAKLEAEAKAKTEAAEKARREAEERARKEAEEKAQLAAKLEQERKAREEAERRAREAEERAKREAEEKARREAEEKAKREAAEKAKREAEEKAKREAEEKAKREAEERRRREEAEAKRRAEEDRRRKEQEEQRAKEDAERKARDEQERKRREDEDRRRKEEDEARTKDEAGRKAGDERERKDREVAEAKAKAAESAPAVADELLADLAAFSAREEEERKSREEQEQKSREQARARAKEADRNRQREEQESQRKRDEQRRKKELEEQREREEEARRARELEEEEQRLAVERKRKARELLAAKETEQRMQAPPEDMVIGPEEIDMDEVERDQQALGKKQARPAAPEREPERGERETKQQRRAREKEERAREKEERAKAKEREREREEERRAREEAATPKRSRKPVNWGRLAGMSLVVALVGGLGVLHLMPLQTAEYERAASQALGVPVKIASGRLSLLTGAQVHLERITIGDGFRIAQLRGDTDFASLFGEQKMFSRVELEGVTLQQGQLGNVLLGKVRGANLRIERIALKQARVDGPVTLPPLDAEVVLANDGSIRSVKATGADRFSLELTPKGGEIAFELNAGSFAVPFVPGLNLGEFGAKGSATRQGMTLSAFDGRAYDGVISGTARIRWGDAWSVEGDLRMRGVNVAVFAPTLVSEGKAEGRGTYSMSGPEIARLGPGARLEGNIKIERGVLGSIDLARAIQTGGTQTAGRTLFAELNAQGLYDKGMVQLRNVTIAAGALTAGASLDIGPDNALAGRIVADVKTATQTLRTTLNVGGTLREPLVRR